MITDAVNDQEISLKFQSELTAMFLEEMGQPLVVCVSSEPTRRA